MFALLSRGFIVQVSAYNTMNWITSVSHASIFYAPDKRKITISQSNHGESAKGMESNEAYSVQSQQVRSVETTGHYEEVKLHVM